MREIAVLTFVSLDGVAQGPVQPDEDRSGGFEHSGWTAGYLDDAMALVNDDLMEAPVSFLFGRKTYEMFAAHWPTAEPSLHGDLLNISQKYLATLKPAETAWQNTKIISGDIVTNLRRLKKEKGPRLQVHGSIDLIQNLIAHDMIDEFRLLTFPVILGSGKRLFGQGTRPLSLRHTRSRISPKGVVMSLYRRN